MLLSAQSSCRRVQVVVAGVKYMFVRGDKDEVYGKKGQEGVVFVKGAPHMTPPHSSGEAVFQGLVCTRANVRRPRG